MFKWDEGDDCRNSKVTISQSPATNCCILQPASAMKGSVACTWRDMEATNCLQMPAYNLLTACLVVGKTNSPIKQHKSMNYFLKLINAYRSCTWGIKCPNAMYKRPRINVTWEITEYDWPNSILELHLLWQQLNVVRDTLQTTNTIHFFVKYSGHPTKFFSLVQEIGYLDNS